MSTNELPPSEDLRAIRYRFDGPVAVVELHRPHRANAWNGTMHGELLDVMHALEHRNDVRAVVITGTPPTFSVGGDSQALGDHAERGSYDTGLSEGTARPGGDLRKEFNEDLSWMFGYQLPIIAAVNGAVAGVSFALACFCDLRFGSAPAKITTAAPKLGLPAEYGLSWTLPRLIGHSRATDLLLSGRMFAGADAAEWGLASEALPAEKVLPRALALAEEIAVHAAPVSVGVSKRLLWRHAPEPTEINRLERKLHLHLMGTADSAEGVRAFMEKREPTWSLSPTEDWPAWLDEH